MIDGVDTGDVTLPDDAGADGVELPVGEYDATFTIVPAALAFTVPEIVSVPLSSTSRSKPVHSSVAVLYVPTDSSNVMPERSGSSSLTLIPLSPASPLLSALTT